jgi:hypothetical protein
MTSELDAIKSRWDRANSFIVTDAQLSASGRDVPRLVAALEAVLELHERQEAKRWTFEECAECSDPEDGIHVTYPCPTVTAVERALKEEQ